MKFECLACGWPTYAVTPPAQDCTRCGAPSDVATSAPLNRWGELHRMALVGFSQDAYRAWERRALSSLAGCGCQQHWPDVLASHPIPFDATPEVQFRWSWKVHDCVSESINSDGSGRLRPRISLAETYGIYRKSGEYETELKYLTDPRVDVVIPFCRGDARYVSEAVNSILQSNHVTPTIHVVGDQCDIPKELFAIARSPTIVDCVLDQANSKRHLQPGVYLYQTLERLGPYHIANIISHHHASEDYFALLDADDISTPDRLWRRLATMQKFGYHMTSGAMENFVDGDEPSLELRRQNELTILSGVEFSHVPNGRCVNSVRTMLRSMFLGLRGFTDDICSMDFDFDNRAYYAGVPVFWGTDVVGRRRLHSASLTNGQEYAHATTNRDRSNQLVRDNLQQLQLKPTFQTARSMGGLPG